MSGQHEEIETLTRRLAEADATIQALLSGQIDAVVDAGSSTPILLATAQAALRESETRYRLIVEATTEGIVRVDADAVIVFSNQRFAAMLGHPMDDVMGKPIFSFMDAESTDLARDARERRMLCVRDSVEVTFRHKTGREVFASLAGAPIFVNGLYAGALSLVRDVTEQKNLMAQLMVSDRMASVGTLAAGVAHEINNPLAVVLANLSFLSQTLLEIPGVGSLPDVMEPLAESLEAANRVRLIVRDLKLFSRSPDEETRDPVDVRNAIESSLRMASNDVRHRARVVTDYGDVPKVSANEPRLGQVLLNLIVNAAQAIPEGHIQENEIRVTTRVEGDRVHIEVRDSGQGIPPENMSRIFDAFYTTKPVGVGTGLGLYISYRIVASMDGTLTVQSTVGKGTTFRVSLPIAAVTEATKPVPVTSA